MVSDTVVDDIPHGTIKVINGKEYVYMADPWTFPEGYGSAWCSVEELERDGIYLNPCKYKNCRKQFPTRVGGCSAISCGVD